jgi:hypothetical protein
MTFADECRRQIIEPQKLKVRLINDDENIMVMDDSGNIVAVLRIENDTLEARTVAGHENNKDRQIFISELMKISEAGRTVTNTASTMTVSAPNYPPVSSTDFS